MTTLRQRSRCLAAVSAMGLCALAAQPARAQHSVAREWNELLLESIRRDFARPTVHARNLYHLSVAMWDSWATYDQTAQPVLFDESHATTSPTVDALRSETLSHAAYTLLRHRFANSPGAAVVLPMYTSLMTTLGYNPADTSTIGNGPAAIGNRIAATVIAYGLADNSNEANGYVNRRYSPLNPALVPALPGNPGMIDPNRWQPLALTFFIDQSGQVILGGYPEFLSPEWGQVSNFSLSQNDMSVHTRTNYDYWVFHDPGDPPYLGTSTAAEYKRGFEMVSIWQSHMDPADGVMIDASPNAIGNATVPATPAQWDSFYDLYNGGDAGTGYTVNPVTGQPYPTQMVPRADYARCLAEFWADGPDSETPPGHWFSILNYVSDHPQAQKRLGGQGPILDDLQWDVKCYLALGGAMHDCAVAAWGVKGRYDFPRPISAIRYMASLGQSTDPAQPSYHPDGISLHPGHIELVTAATTAAGQRHAHLAGSEGKIALRTWRGPNFIFNPATDIAGVGWILADNWWPYQRPTFVTPPFAGYVSGHSTYSRAAAVVLDRLSGSRYFPGGLGEFVCQQDNFLVFERGPSQTVRLQWASYYDASDQCSLSRIWGGIHPRCDDIPGRMIGQAVGEEAFDLAVDYWSGQAAPRASFTTYGNGCIGTNGIVTLRGIRSQLPVLESTLGVEIRDLPVTATTTFMTVGFGAFTPGLDLGLIGAPGCTLDVNFIAALPVPVTSTTSVWTLPMSNDPIFLGASLYLQALTPDPAANPLGLTSSVAGNAFIGR